MTENYYYKPSNYRNHSTCGNKIYNYDFDGYTSMSNIAGRIISDWKFDEQCKKNAENRDKKYKNKNKKGNF